MKYHVTTHPRSLRRAISISLLVLVVAGCSWGSHVVSEYGPHSGAAGVGVPIEWIVYTGCGLTYAYFDLDGSLWLPAAMAPEDQTGTPYGFAAGNDTGTMTLISQDQATYRSSGGRVLELKRMPGHVFLPVGNGDC